MLFRSLAGTLATLLVAAGCAGPDEASTNENPGTLGSGARIGPIELRNVYLTAPADGLHEPGDEGRALLTVFNSGNRDDALVRVTSTRARDIAVRWDRACDGTAEVVSRLPVLAGGTVPAPTDVRASGHLPYHLQVGGFTDVVRPGTTIPLTFHFRHAGEVTLDAIVQHERRPPVQGRYACGVLDRAAA